MLPSGILIATFPVTLRLETAGSFRRSVRIYQITRRHLDIQENHGEESKRFPHFIDN
jgi:hypothetical protein